MTGTLVDTDLLIDHLRGARRLEERPGLHYSVVTRCELFAGPQEHEAAVADLLAPMAEIPVDGEIAEAAGRIRRERGLLVPDALIAATAILRGLELATRNRRDFERVAELRLRG